ncbi:MAG: glycoside hydrolase family 2, partial [Muribaculaceae bacterium]|nr:glycoside hydrolase family 2 [Muribaculaceae bacterium]
MIDMKRIVYSLALIVASLSASAASITNVYGRDYKLLNGRWDAIVDLYDQGDRMKVYENRKPETATDFYEYSFDGGLRLEVPGDWNSQSPELKYYEGTVWYGRHFNAEPRPGEREILYFGAVSYRCNIYLNGKLIGSHEGGFTPFEIDVTDDLKGGDNFLVVEVNNRRTKDAIPALAFDWWNYGGITRDVMLVTVPDNYVRDYTVQLDRSKADVINIDVTMSQPVAGVNVSVDIAGLGKRFDGVTDAEGKVSGSI